MRHRLTCQTGRTTDGVAGGPDPGPQAHQRPFRRGLASRKQGRRAPRPRAFCVRLWESFAARLRAAMPRGGRPAQTHAWTKGEAGAGNGTGRGRGQASGRARPLAAAEDCAGQGAGPEAGRGRPYGRMRTRGCGGRTPGRSRRQPATGEARRRNAGLALGFGAVRIRCLVRPVVGTETGADSTTYQVTVGGTRPAAVAVAEADSEASPHAVAVDLRIRCGHAGAGLAITTVGNLTAWLLGAGPFPGGSIPYNAVLCKEAGAACQRRLVQPPLGFAVCCVAWAAHFA